RAPSGEGQPALRPQPARGATRAWICRRAPLPRPRRAGARDVRVRRRRRAREGSPIAIIDFDSAAPGARSDDLGYALFLWLNLGTDGPPAREQARRITVFCDAYGIREGIDIVEAIANAISRNIERLREQRRLADVGWWQAQLHWVERNRVELTIG